MSAKIVSRAADESFFRPRQKFVQLASDHVPFDEMTGKAAFESKALRECVGREGVVGIIGPRGSGKSSLIAHVCRELPKSHLALRVPVSGADDPTSVSTVGAVTLSQALSDIDMARRQRRAIFRARGDRARVERTRGAGGTLGGGPIPAAIHADLSTLRHQVETNTLAADRLTGIDRLISILVSRGVRPVFVLEDTEAAIGGEDAMIAQRFVEGPIHAFVHEVDAACMIAIQDVFRPVEAFGHLATSMALIEIPNLNEDWCETSPRRDRREPAGAVRRRRTDRCERARRGSPPKAECLLRRNRRKPPGQPRGPAVRQRIRRGDQR